mmetsp:Transcript_66200/g.158335  ORF Transcript_66200/g.158335 Transcript_66200/m.158335 type:complete len:214 (-) Transcript_66200:1029-1670(-)
MAIAGCPMQWRGASVILADRVGPSLKQVGDSVDRTTRSTIVQAGATFGILSIKVTTYFTIELQEEQVAIQRRLEDASRGAGVLPRGDAQLLVSEISGTLFTCQDPLSKHRYELPWWLPLGYTTLSVVVEEATIQRCLDGPPAPNVTLWAARRLRWQQGLISRALTWLRPAAAKRCSPPRRGVWRHQLIVIPGRRQSGSHGSWRQWSTILCRWC